MKLYHVSEEPGIKIFEPRPSPQAFEKITGDVVFAVSDEMLHNYLLPRDCPRVTYFAKADSLQSDIENFIGNSRKKFIINIEESWLERVKHAVLYLYELPIESFILLDKGAGYYVSNKAATPRKVLKAVDLLNDLEKREVELRVLSTLKELAIEVSKSTLQFSIIRMRNAQ